MNWHVFYHDGHYGDGDVGFETFIREDDALEFINARLEYKGASADISSYKLIKGQIVPIEPATTVVKVRIRK